MCPIFLFYVDKDQNRKTRLQNAVFLYLRQIQRLPIVGDHFVLNLQFLL